LALPHLCPRFLHLWDYHPERWSPVLAAKLGGSVILAHVTDTTASAVISVVWTGDAATRTRERVGPGSTYKELEAAYGAGHVFSAEECTWTEARFRSEERRGGEGRQRRGSQKRGQRNGG